MAFFPLIKDRVFSPQTFFIQHGVKLTHFHKVPSKKILGCTEKTVQTPTNFLRKHDR
jgi:hypothetical protein